MLRFAQYDSLKSVGLSKVRIHNLKVMRKEGFGYWYKVDRGVKEVTTQDNIKKLIGNRLGVSCICNELLHFNLIV